jgi:hypothetical protein
MERLALVRMVCAAVDLSQLRPNPPPEELPPVVYQTEPVVWALIALVAAALILIGRELRRRRPTVRLPPDELARQALRDIADQGLPGLGEIERFHRLVCDVLRRYLELRFDYPVTRQTTVEFLETMRRSPRLTESQQGLLREVLRQCDLAKFARALPSEAECDHLLASARRLVDETAETVRPESGLAGPGRIGETEPENEEDQP